MRHTAKIRPLALATALLTAALSSACVIGYEVLVTNRLDIPVVVELTQYHAADFGSSPPAEFTPDLLLETRTVALGPGESARAEFNSAKGGFWVRWRLVGAPAAKTEAATMDLLRDQLTVVVSETPVDDAGGGTDVAVRHLRFAQVLAGARLRLSSRELEALGASIDRNMCRLTASEAASLPGELEKVARSYADDFCAPWMDLWRVSLDDCDGDAPCDEAAVLQRLDLDGYFTSLAAAMEASQDDLERENIMDMILSAFSAHVMGEFGDEAADRWATAAAGPYVREAPHEQVMEFVRRLKETEVGLTPGVRARLQDDVGAGAHLSPQQRSEWNALIERRFSDD